MRVEYLKYFMAVVKYGSISKAANAVYLSPQGLSQAIQQLEKELDVSLFFRQGGHLTLTGAGEEVFRSAAEISEASDRLYQHLQPLRISKGRDRNDRLTIFSSLAVNATILPKALALLHRRRSDVKFHVLEVPPEEMISRYEQDPDSVLIVSLPQTELEKMLSEKPLALDFYEFFRCPFQCLVSAQSPLSQRQTVRFSDLREHSLVLFHLEDRLLEHLALDYDPMKVMLRSSNLSLCRAAVRMEPDAVGFTNPLMERYVSHSSLTAVTLEPRMELVYGYMSAPGRVNDPVCQELFRILKREAKQISV